MEAVSFKLASKKKVLKQKPGVSLFDDAVQTEEENFFQCKRWREEGCKLAEAGKYPQALTCLDACIGLTPEHHVPYELKAQSTLVEKAAEKCVALDPSYAIGFLTLARAQLNFEMAGESIKKAHELDSSNEEITTQLKDIEAILVLKKERDEKPQNEEIQTF